MSTQADDDCRADQQQLPPPPRQEPGPESDAAAPPRAPVTPAEYIYHRVRPRASGNGGGGGGHARAGQGPGQPVMSLDLFLDPDDVALDGGLGSLSGDGEAIRSLRSADVVRDLLRQRPDAATSAWAPAAAAVASRRPPREEHGRDEGGFCPVANLTAQLERISTGDDLAPLDESLRVTSGDWVKDFEGELAGKSLGPMDPTVFTGNPASPAGASGGGGRTDPPTSANDGDDTPTSLPPANYAEYETPLAPPREGEVPPAAPQSILRDDWVEINEQLAGGAAAASSSPSPSPSTVGARKKRKKKRHIDTSRAVSPAENDVLFGRGGECCRAAPSPRGVAFFWI